MFGSRNWGATGIFNTGLFFSQFFLDRFCFLIDFDKKKIDVPNIHLVVPALASVSVLQSAPVGGSVVGVVGPL